MEAKSQSAGDVTEAIRSAPQPLPAPVPGRGGATAFRDGTITLHALIDQYMAAYAGKDPTRPQRLNFWVAKLGPVQLAQIDDDAVFAVLEELANQRGRYFAGHDADGKQIWKAKKKQLSGASINRYAAALGAVLTWSIKRRIAPKGFVNPVKAIERKPESDGVVRYLDEAERNALLAACKASKWSKLYLLVFLAITTGARRGELERMRWRDVDFDRGEIVIETTKNGDPKIVPLASKAVVAELRRHIGVPSALIFASMRRPDVPYNSVPIWQTALKKAGIRNFRFHDLRHTTASYLAQAGAPLLQIAHELGHRNLSVTQRYTHLATKDKTDLIQKVFGGIK